MGFILKKVVLNDLMERKPIYSKQIRGNLPFTVETHTLNDGKNLQIFLYRDNDRIKEYISDVLPNYMTTQHTKITVPNTTIRLSINDKNFMIPCMGEAKIEIVEYNFNSQDLEIVGFDKGKVAILINIFWEMPNDNSKFKKELKDELGGL